MVESITLIAASDDGFTHSPPMKKLSAWRSDAAAWLAMDILVLSQLMVSGIRW